MRPQDGVAGLEQRIKDIEEKQARTDALLGVTSTSGAGGGVGAGGGLGAGFNFDGEMIGVLTGRAPAIDAGSGATEPEPVTWTKVKSDYGITYDDARIQLPSDGFYMVLLSFTEVWARRTNRAGNTGTFFRIIDGGNIAGVIVFASSQYGGVTGAAVPGTEIVGGALLGYGNAVAFGLSATYTTDGRPPGVILPTRIDVVAEVHRILEG